MASKQSLSNGAFGLELKMFKCIRRVAPFGKLRVLSALSDSAPPTAMAIINFVIKI